MSYIDQGVLDECREALRLGCQLEYLAGKLRCSPEHLARLLDLPATLAATTPTSDSCDLWRVDSLDDVL